MAAVAVVTDVETPLAIRCGKSVGTSLVSAYSGAARSLLANSGDEDFCNFDTPGVTVIAASGAATRIAPAKTPTANERATGPRADLPSRTRATRRASELLDGATPCAPSSNPGHS